MSLERRGSGNLCCFWFFAVSLTLILRGYVCCFGRGGHAIAFLLCSTVIIKQSLTVGSTKYKVPYSMLAYFEHGTLYLVLLIFMYGLCVAEAVAAGATFIACQSRIQLRCGNPGERFGAVALARAGLVGHRNVEAFALLNGYGLAGPAHLVQRLIHAVHEDDRQVAWAEHSHGALRRFGFIVDYMNRDVRFGTSDRV